jgi:hypothetical protein
MSITWKRRFVFGALAFFWLAFMASMCSCNQKAWTKRGYSKGWIKSDTITETIITESDSKDTIFKHSIYRDTVVLKENKLTVKYFYNNSDSTVYLSGKCDSDTLYVDKYITRIETKEDHSDWPYWLVIGILFLLLLWLTRRK